VISITDPPLTNVLYVADALQVIAELSRLLAEQPKEELAVVPS
jgi:hypothetical protein